MGFKCGIVGLPNVGKSTLFNALTASKNAEAANFPFCTIDPNIGIVDVIDYRLDKLAELSKSKKKIYTNITFVDIAGLVKGASKGEGLGNKFLSHIREVDAIIHLVRCFESEKITHVNSKINPAEDLDVIKTEIILSDLDVIQKKFHEGGEDWLEKAESKVPFKRLTKPIDVARAAAYFCSEESGLVTGSIIDYDQTVNGWHSYSAYETSILDDSLLGE